MIFSRRHLSLLALAGACLSAGSQAHALVKVARGTLNATARVNMEYDTNIFANSSEVDDLSMVFIPGLSYSRSVGVISTVAELGVRAISFADTNGQDSLDPYLNGNFTMDRAEKGSVSAGFRYARTSDANEVLLTRTESDEFRGNVRVDYFYSEKTGVRTNAQFRVSDYNTTGYNSIESYSAGAGLLYRYSPKLTANLSYDFSPEKATDLGAATSNPSSDNHRFSVGLEGELRPKLNGNVSVGMVYRDFEAGGSDNTVLLGSSLSWAASEKTNFTLAASNNFDTTASAESIRTLVVSVGVRQALTEKISLSANVGTTRSKLDQVPGPGTRRDKALLFGTSLNYRINDHFSANSGVSHRINDSSLQLADYDRTVFSLGLNATF